MQTPPKKNRPLPSSRTLWILRLLRWVFAALQKSPRIFLRLVRYYFDLRKSRRLSLGRWTNWFWKRRRKRCFSFDEKGYRFSSAKKNPGFIGIDDIQNVYLPNGFYNFKIEGRGLGSAMLLEFLLYYVVKTEFQLVVREEHYLDAMLDLF